MSYMTSVNVAGKIIKLVDSAESNSTPSEHTCID